MRQAVVPSWSEIFWNTFLKLIRQKTRSLWYYWLYPHCQAEVMQIGFFFAIRESFCKFNIMSHLTTDVFCFWWCRWLIRRLYQCIFDISEDGCVHITVSYRSLVIMNVSHQDNTIWAKNSDLMDEVCNENVALVRTGRPLSGRLLCDGKLTNC